MRMNNANEGSSMQETERAPDRVIWRRELQAAAHVSSETIRRWMRDAKLPAPDVALSHRTKGWRVSTLRAAGIDLFT
jgi:predicted DNA-binding transcriptional regulator AlpA